MKRLTLLLAFAAFFTGAIHAQEITGTWQGPLKIDDHRELRIVLKISQTEAALKTVMYSIDQGGNPITASSTSFQGGVFKYGVPGIGGSYEGTISSDGSTLIGKWTQGESPLPLVFKHMTPETAWAIPEAQKPLPAMAADADPTFEVATIKPSKPDQPGKAFQVRGRSFSTINTTLIDLITFAYEVQAKQVTGGPAWASADKFDIVAQPDIAGQPNDRQLKLMVKKLLTERFKLTLHNDSKELSVYALTVGKTGPKIAKSEGDPNGLPGLFFRGLGQLTVRNATMPDFAHLMQSAVLDRPVVDQTGLAGRYDFALTWTPDESQFGGMGVKVPPPGDKADAPPGLFTATQEQMGMKLDATKAAVEVLVLDKVEKPTDN